MPSKRKPEAAAVWMPIGDLTPWADNPRDNAAAVPEVAKSITRFGFASPIIARPIEGGFEIIAGHTRHQAALSLGLDRVPVRVMDLDPTDAKLLALADNKVGEIATWTDGLGDLLRELEADGIDLDGLGFGDGEIEGLLGGDSTWEHDTAAGGSLDSLDVFLENTICRLTLSYDAETLAAVVGRLDDHMEATGLPDHSAAVADILGATGENTGS